MSARLLLNALVLCFAAAPPLLADDWPQWRGPRRDGVWREEGIVEQLPGRLDRLWTTPIGSGYAGPAVAAGRVFVTDRVLEEGERNPNDPFARRQILGKERVLALDALTGKVLWTHEYPCRYEVSYPYGPRATPTVDGESVYTLGAMGDLFRLDARTGKVLWSKNYPRDFGTEMNTWGMSAAPLVEGERLLLLAGGADGACVIALDKKSGAELWRALDAGDPGYAPPVIFEAGGVRQLVIWTPEAVSSLDPTTGKVYWREPFAVSSGLSVATPVFDAERGLLLVSAFYNGSRMFRLDRDRPAATLLWRGKSDSEKQTDGLHALMCTPVLERGYLYGVCSYGQLRCLDASTGQRLWETLDATGEGRWWNAFLVKHRDRTFIANEQGELILAKLSPDGYEELGRAPLLEPTRRVQRRLTVWSHPAFAGRRVYARNDKEIVCVDLAAKGADASKAASE